MRYYLELIGDGHEKYYEAKAIGSVASFHWGRIGTIGQSKAFQFETGEEAKGYVAKKLQEKLGEGYELKEAETMKVKA